MRNKVISNITYKKHVPTIIIFLLPLLACALFAPSSIKGLRSMAEGENLLREKFDEAVKAFSEAITLTEYVDERGNKGREETLVRIYKLRGTAYSKLEDHDRSLEDFNKSIEINQDGVEPAYAERGILFLVKKDYEKAIADFEKAKPAFSKDYRATLGMAIAYYETQKYEKADEFISIALRDLKDLRDSKKQYVYDPNDHVKAYECSIKLSERKGDTKNSEIDKKVLESLKKKHSKNG